MHLKIYEYDMKLKYPFSISRHTYFSQPTIILELNHGGFTGYGEATVNPYYKITIDSLITCFYSIRDRLANYDFQSPDKLFDDYFDLLSINSFALGALNNASWDLYGKINNVAVSDLIDLPKINKPLTSYTLGIDSKDALLKKITELPWPVYKVKLGTDNDLELIQHLRAHTKSDIRVDANCAWDSAKTIRLSKHLKQLDVEFIEQPLPANHPEQAICFEKSLLPLIADESCCTESDVKKCVDEFHGINIKLLKCGGLTPALRMIKIARSLALKIMVGCMTETSVGISAASQLLPFVDYADLDGPLLLAEDLADGIQYDFGKIKTSNNIGLGINFKGKNQ